MAYRHFGPIETLNHAWQARMDLWVLCRGCGYARRVKPSHLVVDRGNMSLAKLQEKTEMPALRRPARCDRAPRRARTGAMTEAEMSGRKDGADWADLYIEIGGVTSLDGVEIGSDVPPCTSDNAETAEGCLMVAWHLGSGKLGRLSPQQGERHALAAKPSDGL
jgi:hypothetical protein